MDSLKIQVMALIANRLHLTFFSPLKSRWLHSNARWSLTAWGDVIVCSSYQVCCRIYSIANKAHRWICSNSATLVRFPKIDMRRQRSCQNFIELFIQLTLPSPFALLCCFREWFSYACLVRSDPNLPMSSYCPRWGRRVENSNHYLGNAEAWRRVATCSQTDQLRWYFARDLHDTRLRLEELARAFSRCPWRRMPEWCVSFSSCDVVNAFEVVEWMKSEPKINHVERQFNLWACVNKPRYCYRSTDLKSHFYASLRCSCQSALCSRKSCCYGLTSSQYDYHVRDQCCLPLEGSGCVACSVMVAGLTSHVAYLVIWDADWGGGHLEEIKVSKIKYTTCQSIHFLHDFQGSEWLHFD